MSLPDNISTLVRNAMRIKPALTKPLEAHRFAAIERRHAFMIERRRKALADQLALLHHVGQWLVRVEAQRTVRLSEDEDDSRMKLPAIKVPVRIWGLTATIVIRANLGMSSTKWVIAGAEAGWIHDLTELRGLRLLKIASRDSDQFNTAVYTFCADVSRRYDGDINDLDNLS